MAKVTITIDLDDDVYIPDPKQTVDNILLDVIRYQCYRVQSMDGLSLFRNGEKVGEVTVNG